MTTIFRNILAKDENKKRNNLKRGEVEKRLDILEENVIHTQGILSVGSWTYDIENDELLCTEEIYKIIEVTPEYIDGKYERFLDFIHPQDKEVVIKAYEEALKGNKYNIEIRIITASGREKYVKKKAKVLFNENKKPIKIIGTIQDITRNKLLEKNLMELGQDLKESQKVAGVGRFKYDAIKDEIFISEEVYKIYNIDPLVLKKDVKSYEKIIHPEDR
ncbi:MAG: PAS domain-containing protein, partial [Clostridiales bacterium]|nr:PAS domain-containing protein [Clostridiales bacterium]